MEPRPWRIQSEVLAIKYPLQYLTCRAKKEIPAILLEQKVASVCSVCLKYLIRASLYMNTDSPLVITAAQVCYKDLDPCILFFEVV